MFAGRIRAIGSETAGEIVTLLASDLPPNQFGYFLTSQTQGASQPPGSSGLLCLGGNIGRFNRPGEIGFTGTAGAYSLDVDTNDIPLAPGAIQSGETWNFQAWHRDVVGGAATSNFTDAIEVDFL